MKKLTPLAAIRQHCLYCMNSRRDFVRECNATDCPLWPYRLGKLPPLGQERRPLRAIRRFCLTCVASPAEVRTCSACVPYGGQPACPLFEYRFGVRPATIAQRDRKRVQRQESLFGSGTGRGKGKGEKSQFNGPTLAPMCVFEDAT